MAWSITFLVVQIVAGILGANAAATAVKDHNFGLIGHTIAGAVGGGLSGYFLQKFAIMMVTGADTFNKPSFAEQIILEGLAGAVSGGIAMLLFGIIKHVVDQGSSAKR
jgi:uncharacterized membrane protein YeaQ/YmgE (transglycosylase-associated protein family)